MNNAITTLTIIALLIFALIAVLTCLITQDELDRETANAKKYRDKFLTATRQCGRYYGDGYLHGSEDKEGK